MTDSLPNWFASDGVKNFEKHLLKEFLDKPIKALQIGAYKGDASIWLYNNFLKNNSEAFLIDIDTWEGSEEPSHKTMNWGSVEETYDFVTQEGQADKSIIKFKGTSDSFFKQNQVNFNFIYVDGDHTSYGVIKDAVNSYEYLEVGGILAFDDYRWSAGLGALKEPRMAIDFFSDIYRDRVKLIFRDYQCWYRKVA
jgi:hypothetical protein